MKIFISNALKIYLLTAFVFISIISAQEKTADNISELSAKAQKLVAENKYIEALPILEKIAPALSDDAEFMAHYGIAVVTNSVTLKTPEARKKERVRGLEILNRAKKLGTDNVRALNLIDQFPADGGDEDNFDDENPAASEALREGEAFFGRGEYDKAFTAYERAYKINPKSYEAVLFMGDSRYSQRKYDEAVIWFAKAAELAPDREMAHRFWGDAFLAQKKYKEALDKFADALLAAPFSRMSWDSLSRWSDQSGNEIKLLNISPPGNDLSGELKINEASLKADDGTIHWKLYSDTRQKQILKNAGTNTRHNLADEAAAWRKVAEAVRADIKAGKIKYPDQSLVNLIKTDDAGFLESYILMFRGHEDFDDDYLNYRAKNRARMKRFILESMLGVKI
jgi:tetratricopeptide (TPR) repeat protein